MHARDALALGGGSRYFRALMDSLLDAVVIADETGLIWGYNRAAHRLFGHAPGEVFGHPVSLLIPARYWREDVASDAPTDGTSAGNRQRIEGRRKDGRAYACELDITCFVVERQKYLVGVARELAAPGPPGLSPAGVAGQSLEDAV